VKKEVELSNANKNLKAKAFYCKLSRIFQKIHQLQYSTGN